MDSITIALIGDGVVAALTPQSHVRRWKVGPQWWQDAMRPFVDRPDLTRVLGASEAAVGVILALRLAQRD